ncbi:SurA N-terminal domain-containing protein [Roseococcus sp. DSY-14]|uniref:peptidylprolyl isomerase n=1 Tax=Roseococcus sp. DSY-14 TaxID=3369650 RepID=UPI00387AE1F9
MRRLAGTWFAKALFVLLILSFAVWGIDDMVRNIGRDTAVARVGGEAIEAQEAQEAATRELQRITRQLQGSFTPDARIRRAVAEQAVDGLVLDRVQRQEAARMGVAVPDEAVRAYVFRIPGFQGPDGRFSREAFNGFLRNNDLSEGQFLNLLRTDLARQQLGGAVRAGAAAPAVLGERLLAWQLERRTATLVELPWDAAPEPPAPTEAQLARFHENEAARFSTPEYREVAVAVLNAARMMAQVEVSEREIEDSYAANRARWGTPERREVFQAIVPAEDAAAALAAQWRGGAEFPAIEEAARAAGGGATTLGVVAREDLPLPALAESAFALPAGGVSAPVRTPFGWHVLRAGAVTPGTQRGLEEVRAEIREALAAEKAADESFDRANRVEDALAGGATVAEAARRYDLGFAEVRLDAQGKAPDGTEAELPVAEPAREAALRAIFAAERGAAPRFAEGPWGFMAVEVRDVTPPALIPLEQVRAQVEEAWVAAQKRRFQEERAAALLAAARAGTPLAQAAEAAGLAPEQIGPFARQPGGGNPMPREALAPAFELPVGGATMVQLPRAFAVVQLLSVQRPEAASEPEALRALRAEVARGMAEDLEAQWQAALRRRADVRINPRLVQQIAGEDR